MLGRKCGARNGYVGENLSDVVRGFGGQWVGATEVLVDVTLTVVIGGDGQNPISEGGIELVEECRGLVDLVDGIRLGEGNGSASAGEVLRHELHDARGARAGEGGA